MISAGNPDDALARLATWAHRHEARILLGIAIVAATTQLLLFATSPQPFGYIYDHYHHGVEWIYNKGRLPWYWSCWVCAHPPLFFIVGVVPYSVVAWLTSGNLEIALRSLFLVTLPCFAWICYSCWRMLRLFGVSGLRLVLSLSIAAVLPCLAISGWGPEADILLTAIHCEFLYQLLRCHVHNRITYKDAAFLGFLAGLALLTKYSGLLTLVWAGGWLLVRLLTGPERRQIIVSGMIIVGLAGALAGWRYVRNYMIHGTPFIAQGTATEGFTLLKGRAHIEQYDFRSLRLVDAASLYEENAPQGYLTLQPVYNSVWTTLHAMTWTDMSFFSNPTRHGAWPDEKLYPKKTIPPGLVVVLLHLALVPLALKATGFFLTIRHSHYWPLAFVVVTTFAVYFYWATAQDMWALKTKYILFLLPVMLVYMAVGLKAALAVRLRPVGWTVLILLASLVLCSEAFLLRFAI